MIALARWVVANPRPWLVLVASITFALAIGVTRLELRTEGAALHPSGNAVIVGQEVDRGIFEEPRQVIIVVSCREKRNCLASPEGFDMLRRLHAALAALPAVRVDGLESLAGLLRVERRAGHLSVRPYLDDVPGDAAAFAALVEDLRAHPLTDGLLLSAAGDVAAFYVPLVEHRPVPELVAELRGWLESGEGGTSRIEGAEAVEIRLMGPLVAETLLGEMVLRDLAVLVPVMLGVIVVVLYLIFGSPAGILIPLVEALVVLIWTFGAMGFAGVPVTLVTTILPVVLMAMAITDEIHLLERFRAHRGHLPRDEAVVAALEEVGRPIVLTSVTTALGFLSFLSASVEPLNAFGLFTAFGILAAMVLTFVWIPALIVVLPAGWLEVPRWHRPPTLGLQRLAEWPARRPAAAFVLGVLALAATLPGLGRLEVQDAWVGNFDPDSSLVRAEEIFNDAFWGSYRFDVVLEAEPDFFYSSAGAALVEAVREGVAGAPGVGGVVSFDRLLGELARALGETPRLSQLPQGGVADLATLAEMSDERVGLRQLLSERGDRARARLHVSDSDYRRALALRDFLDAELPPLLEGTPVRHHYGGELAVALEVVREIVRNQLRSIGWTLALVGLLLVVFSPGRITGVVALLPVSVAVLGLLGGMGLTGLPLGIATSMFASLTVGIGVDFAIHFLHRYRMERLQGVGDTEALVATARQTGLALRWNVAVLAAGFAVLSLSTLKPNHSLGLLLSTAMLSCYASTLLLLPRLARYTLRGDASGLRSPAP